jgi:tetratricopeptide (TPR) repeat protein
MTEPTGENPLFDEGAIPTHGRPAARGRFIALTEAHELYKNNQYDEAESISRALIAIDPDDVHARTLLAACLYRRGLITEALTHTERALAVWPEDEDLLTLQDVLLVTLTERYEGRRLCA